MKPARSSNESVRVFCRFRPLNEKEKNFPLCVSFEGVDRVVCRQVQAPRVSSAEDSLQSTGRTDEYAFSRVYLPDAAQKTIYEDVVHPIVSDVMNGYNGTVFVYGQTVSGKTHSMFGAYIHQNSPGRTPLFNFHIEDDIGIIPRAAQDIFRYIHNANESVEFEIRVLFIEIYMECVRDLLNPTGINLNVREDTVLNSFYIEGCEMPYVTSPEEIMHLVSVGFRRRATATTASNDASSRSHCVLNIMVKSVDHAKRETTIGKLYLVDLAGSEKVSKTQAAGLQLEEAKLINRSLTTLGYVIKSLAEKHVFVPYRDSKLTRILKDSLGGNSRTALVVCCSPSILCDHKTISSLQFGVRAQNIRNHAVVNRQFTIEELKSMLVLSKLEIQTLRSQLLSAHALGIGPMPTLQHSEDAAAVVVVPTVGTSTTSHNVPTVADRSARHRADSEGDMECDSAESPLHSGGREPLDLIDSHADIETLREALREAQESARLLRTQSAAQASMLQLLRDECTVWEEEHAKVSRELFAHRRYGEHCCALLRESRDEVSLLAHRVAVYYEQLRGARTLLGEQRLASQQQWLPSTSSNISNKNIVEINNTNDKSITDKGKLMHPNGNSKNHVSVLDKVQSSHLPDLNHFDTSETACPPCANETVHTQADWTCHTDRTSANREGLDVNADNKNDTEYYSRDEAHTMLVERMHAMMDELELLRNASGALTLELQLAEKKLAFRHDRIESLKVSLRRECAANHELLLTLDNERAAHRAQLREANNGTLYWRECYKDLLSTCHVRRGHSTKHRVGKKNSGTPTLERMLASTICGNSRRGSNITVQNISGFTPGEEQVLDVGHGIIVKPIRGGGKQDSGDAPDSANVF